MAAAAEAAATGACLLCPLEPQTNGCRQLVDLSGLWDFQADTEGRGITNGWPLRLPQPRRIAVPGSWNEQINELRDYMGPAWYSQQVELPPGFANVGRRVLLRVGSANYTCSVYVDGALVCKHEGGHLPFQVDITRAAVAAAAAFRSVTVSLLVDGTLSSSAVPPGDLAQRQQQHPNVSYDFFPYCGIHRAVTLISLPTHHITDLTVTTQLEAGGTALVTVTVATDRVIAPAIFCSAALASPHGGTKAASAAAPLVSRDTEMGCELKLRVPAAQLWSPSSPSLYSLRVEYRYGGGTGGLAAGAGESANEFPLDCYTLAVGLRTVSVAGDALLLNGQPLRLQGFGRHEDFPGVGRGFCAAVAVKDTALVRWCGGNSFRTSHYPYSEAALALADSEGLAVIAESPAAYLCFHDDDAAIAARLAQCARAQRELIARDKNRACVLMWSLANEPEANQHIATHGTNVPPPEDDTWRAKGAAFFKEIFAAARSQDPTRPLTLAAHPLGCRSWLASCDVICTNRYNGWYGEPGRLEAGVAALGKKLDDEHAALKKPFIISEFGADALAGTHADPPEMWSEEYQADMIEKYLDMAAERPWIVGMHVWNLADFKTPQAVRRPGGLNHKGVFTRDRKPKLAAHALRKRWFRPEAQPVGWPGSTKKPE